MENNFGKVDLWQKLSAGVAFNGRNDFFNKKLKRTEICDYFHYIIEYIYIY